MEAIGGEVMIAFIPLAIVGFVGLYYTISSIKRSFAGERGGAELVEDRPRYGDGVCSICL